MKITGKLQSELIPVEVEYNDGEHETKYFRSERAARAFINDEIQWESCVCCRMGQEVFDGFFNFTEVGG